MSYQLLLTNAGAAKIAAASNAGGTPLHITDFAVGQGVNVDFSTRLDKQTLVAKRYQGKVESVNLVAPNKYEIVCVVPVDVGGFTIREFGLIDSDGVLVWVGSLPEVQKPTADSLSAVDYRLKAVVQIDNPQVSIVIDANAITATQSWVNANFAAIGHNHQDMLDRLTALENRIFEAIAVGGIYATAKLYAKGQDVHAELGYGVWALYAQSKILAGFSTIATDDNKFKTMGNVFEIGSEIENQKAIVAQFWKRLPNDYIAPTFDMYYTSDEAGLNRVTVIGEETPIYLWLNVTNVTQPIQIISFLSDASGTIHLTNSNINHPKTVNNGKTLLVSIPQDNYSVDNPVTLNWGFVLNDPTVDVETAINAPLAINNTVSDAPPAPTMDYNGLKFQIYIRNNNGKIKVEPKVLENNSPYIIRAGDLVTEGQQGLVMTNLPSNLQKPFSYFTVEQNPINAYSGCAMTRYSSSEGTAEFTVLTQKAFDDFAKGLIPDGTLINTVKLTYQP